MNILSRLKSVRFELRHLIILFVILAILQVALSFMNSNSKNNLLVQSLNIYSNDTVKRIAELTSSSLEILLEHSLSNPPVNEQEKMKLIQKLNILISQQKLQKNVNDFGIIVEKFNRVSLIKNGGELYSIFFENGNIKQNLQQDNTPVLTWYEKNHEEFVNSEQIYSESLENNVVNVYVPLVLYGEFNGLIYMQISPDFINISEEISFDRDINGALFTAVILFGMIGMFYISSYTVQERDKYQSRLMDERESQLREQINHHKEAVFTRRIYHAHHKAEKIMGFIKDDIKSINKNNLTTIQSRVNKYANFVARVIYDMKSYDPPISVIRNQAFNTDLNEVIRFIVNNVFYRVYGKSYKYKIKLKLFKSVKPVHINEYVVWQILEPLIQNSIDHNKNNDLEIEINTNSLFEDNKTEIIISDNGTGFSEDFLEMDENGIQKLFREQTTSKTDAYRSGYGCFIAYENCKRCGWQILARNNDRNGSSIIITIPETYNDQS